MRIVLASSFVPFVDGGARFIVEWLEEVLADHGHTVERFYLPFIEDPDNLIDQLAAYRMIDLQDAGDLLIAFRPPAHLLRHPNKILWFIHHIRAYYDLWGTSYGPSPTPAAGALRNALMTLDNRAFGEARKIFTNSSVVSRRLQTFNGVAAQPLYPPIRRPERFRCAGYGDEILCVCRVVSHKRQALLVAAMAHTRTPVRLRLCGVCGEGDYGRIIQDVISRNGLVDRVRVDDRWISEEEKAELLTKALAVAYLPKDEDSYGYPSLEAAHARKAVITTDDAGGVSELIVDRHNGLVTRPDPLALAQAMDELFLNRGWARQLGEANHARVAELNIDWSHVVETLTT